jgi:hypothetical protein
MKLSRKDLIAVPLKAEYGASTENIGNMMCRFMELIQEHALHRVPRILIIFPPTVDEETPYCWQGISILGREINPGSLLPFTKNLPMILAFLS